MFTNDSGWQPAWFSEGYLIQCALVFFSSRRTDSRTGQTLESVQSAFSSLFSLNTLSINSVSFTLINVAIAA